MLIATLEPRMPSGGETLLLVVLLAFGALVLVPAAFGFLLGLLDWVSRWASLTLIVFFRKSMGVRAITVKDLVIGILFLYFVGNIVGHNYHDLYRDVASTVWGARVHFSYLVLALAMSVYRKVEAWQQRTVTNPSSWGTRSRLSQFLAQLVGVKEGLFADVVIEPLAVVLVGLFAGLVLRNWFGWYLVLAGCLFFWWLLRARLQKRDAALDIREMTLAAQDASLDMRNNPPPMPPGG